jgi:hypothetical protein
MDLETKQQRHTSANTSNSGTTTTTTASRLNPVGPLKRAFRSISRFFCAGSSLEYRGDAVLVEDDVVWKDCGW